MSKKKDAKFFSQDCPHCRKSFEYPFRFCPKCEDHIHTGVGAFFLKKDVCDRCFTGKNDDYIKLRNRPVATVTCDPELEKWAKEAAEKFEAYTHTEEWRTRFGPVVDEPPQQEFGYGQATSENASIRRDDSKPWYEELNEPGDHIVVHQFVEVASHGPSGGDDGSEEEPLRRGVPTLRS